MQISFWHICSIVALHIVSEVSSCSLSCTCKWKNGKRTAECPNKSLTEIPENIDPETQVLDVSDNNLGKLTKELFLKKQLVNLQRLYLSKCRIKTIHKETFKGLTNLVEMDLSNNFLENVPTATFSNCPSLMKLTLSSNPIKDVKRLAFNHLSYLNTLELSGCEILDIEEGAFQGLHSLEWLHLDSNRLKTIHGPSSIPKTLKGIELQKNPWTCDCHIQNFHDWLLNFPVPLSSDPECTKPIRLRNTLVKNVPKEDLACLPEVLPTTLYLELTEGKNLSLLCHIHAVPEATVSWWFDGQLLQNNTSIAPGVHLVYFVEEGTENKRSELFIFNTNAEDNGTYVCHAENAAGSAQSNFTIKIILKEEPVVILVSFPIEYLIYAVASVLVCAFIILVVVIVCLIKCHKKKKRQMKRDQTKEATLHLQNQRHGNEDKNWTSKTISSSPLDQQLKQNNATSVMQTTTCTAETEEMVLYGIRTCDDPFANNLSPMRTANRNQAVSPLSLRRYQLEQNPDLINGTESIGCRRAGDGEDVRQRGEEEPAVMVPGVSCIRNGADFYTAEQTGIEPSTSATQHCTTCRIDVPANRWGGHLRTLGHREKCCVMQEEEGVELIRTSFRSRIATYRLTSSQDPTNVKQYLQHQKQKFVKLVGDICAKYEQLKVGLELFGRFLLQSNESEEVKSFNTKYQLVSRATDLEELFEQFSTILDRKYSEFMEKDSGLRHVDSQGYPVDYGLPKMPCRPSCNEAYYRTLPCNRMKRHSAANPLKRYSREVEFLSRSTDSPYDHYHTTDVRYTADGYPVPRQMPSEISHPNASTQPPIPCCSVNWPPCLPVNPQRIPSVSKRSASAQTDTEDECESISVSVPAKTENVNINVPNDNVNDVLTESPDEGYEGEPSVV